MSGFFWASGHPGWGIFALVVFTGVWWLLIDLVWRLKATRVVGLALAASGGWLLGIGLITLGFCLAAR